MAYRWRINLLTPWLARHGAKRGDLLLDRATEPNRYVIVRALPAAGETTGHVLDAIGRGYLDDLGAGDDLPMPASSRIRLVSERRSGGRRQGD